MLQRSKLEEPNYWHMWRHLHQLCSLQRAVGEGEDGREKGLWQDVQAEIPIPLKNAFFQKKKRTKTFKIIYMNAAAVVNLTKQQTQSAECFDAKDVGKQSAG